MKLVGVAVTDVQQACWNLEQGDDYGVFISEQGVLYLLVHGCKNPKPGVGATLAHEAVERFIAMETVSGNEWEAIYVLSCYSARSLNKTVRDYSLILTEKAIRLNLDADYVEVVEVG